MAAAILPNLKHWPLHYTSCESIRRGRWLVRGASRNFTQWLDLDAWPPAPTLHDQEYVVDFDILPDGRVAVCSMLTRPPTEYQVRIYPPGWPARSCAEPPEVIPIPGRRGPCHVWTIGDRVVIADRSPDPNGPPECRRAFLLCGDSFEVIDELPPVQSFKERPLSSPTHAHGKATLGDGTEVLIWDGTGYEWADGGFRPTWDLGILNNFLSAGLSSVPHGPDGFFILSDRRVFHAERDKTPVPILSDATNVMGLSPGPADSVILSFGQNSRSLTACLYFPEEKTLIPLKRKQFGIAPQFSPTMLCWSPATRQFVTTCGDLITVPETDILDRPRVPVRPSRGGKSAR